MECPKCAAVQADDGVECTACGVVFARFREAQERALLSRTNSQRDAIPIEPAATVPRSLMIVGVILVLAFGVIWTARRRESRTKFNADAAASAMLDDINNKGQKTRQRLQEEADRAEAMRNQALHAQQSAPAPRPVGLTEESATSILNQCSGFNTYEEILLPKSYTDFQRDSLDERYPAFALARKDKVVEVTSAQTHWVVTVPDTAHFRMTIKEDENHYIIPLGRRRITAIRNLAGGADRAEARFEFTFEERVAGESLVQPYTNFYGHATFILKDNAWRALDATTLSHDGRRVALHLCS